MTKTDFIGKHMLLRNFVIVFHRLITDRGVFRGVALWHCDLKVSSSQLIPEYVPLLSTFSLWKNVFRFENWASHCILIEMKRKKCYQTVLKLSD